MAKNDMDKIFRDAKRRMSRRRFWKKQGVIIMGWLIFFSVLLAIDFLRPIDDTDKSRRKRSGLSLYTDHKTGLQYIKGGFFGGLTPRRNKVGNHIGVGE